MDKEQRFWLGIWSIVATVVAVFIIAVAVNDYKVKKLWIENGYEQVMDIGNSNRLWKKIK